MYYAYTRGGAIVVSEDRIPKKKNRKKAVIISAAVFILILIAVAVIYIGPENFKAAYYGFKYDKNQISNIITESSQRLDETVSAYDYITTREPTKEEMDAVNQGVINEEDLSKIISTGKTLNEYLENPEAVTPAEPEKPDDSEKARLDAECDAKVSQIVSKMYVLRASFTSALANLASQAQAEHAAGIPLSDLAGKYMGQAQSLEAQCNGNVDALMTELTAILTEYGRSTELVDTIYETYNNEKQYTKAYYMSLYLNN